MVAKRVFDLALGVIALVLMLPAIAVIAAIVAIDTRGAYLFRHRRLGRGGQPITILKFRTTRRGLVLTPEQQAEFNKTFKLANDPRVTRVGRILRKTSLDEIPQILNVLQGSLSLVGPRPIVAGELEKYGDAGPELLSVKPGVTGLWQVSGRSALSYEDRVELDLEYVRRRGFWFDLWILVRTVPAVFRGGEAA